jgi:hypothetical protein
MGALSGVAAQVIRQFVYGALAGAAWVLCVCAMGLWLL